MSVGWILLLALILEWSSVHWSRPAIALQGLALVLALLVSQRIGTRRLIVYPLILAGSIYLWDTTLPPPSLPNGWPRLLIPRLVLISLLVDYALVMHRVRQARKNAGNIQRRIALDDAASLLGLSTAELRQHMQKQRRPIVIDAAGLEQVSLDDVEALSHPKKTPWHQLYLWFLLMVVLLLSVSLASLPQAWKTAVQVIWLFLTSAGMGVWVLLNRTGLQEEEWKKPTAWEQYAEPSSADLKRTIPLTPVQQRFLAIMKRRDHQ
jgi:hypothetical protein